MRRPSFWATFTSISLSMLMLSIPADAEPKNGNSGGFVVDHRVQPDPKQKHSGGPVALSDRRFSVQAALQTAADEIQRVVRKEKAVGFAAIDLDLARNAIRLLWNGDVPQSVKWAAGRTGVKVEVVPTPYSAAELDAAARELLENPPAELSGLINSAGPNSTFTGLQIGVNGSVDAERLQAHSADAVPVTQVRHAEPASAAWRWGDSEPFWGGSAIDRLVDPILRNYVYCTTAFPVLKSNGQEALLTAAHCGPNEDWRTPDGDRFVGRSEPGRADLDATVLTGARYGSSIYVGTWNSNTFRPVVGAGNPALNSYVFASGSWSGASTLRVTQVNQYISLDGTVVGPGFWVENEERTASVGQGDSGGPVAGPNGTDPSTVLARGIISVIDLNTEGPCTGMIYDGRRCAWRSFHINIDNALSGLGLTIKTS